MYIYIYIYLYYCDYWRHLRDYWETCFMSPGSFAPYLIIVASFVKYWHTHVSRYTTRFFSANIKNSDVNNNVTISHNIILRFDYRETFRNVNIFLQYIYIPYETSSILLLNIALRTASLSTKNAQIIKYTFLCFIFRATKLFRKQGQAELFTGEERHSASCFFALRKFLKLAMFWMNKGYLTIQESNLVQNVNNQKNIDVNFRRALH